MLRNTLDIFLGLAILASGIVGGVMAEAQFGVSRWIAGDEIAQASNCPSTSEVSFGPDARWEELPETTLVDALPVFVHGAEESPLRVQVFLDSECPFSRQYVLNVLPGLLARDDIRLEFHDFPLPFNPNAEQAAQAGRCAAQQGGYLEFVTALAGYETPDVKAAVLAAGAAGLDMEQLLQCLLTQESNVKLDFMAGHGAGVRGTPTTVINGRAIVGALPWETFERLLSEAFVVTEALP